MGTALRRRVRRRDYVRAMVGAIKSPIRSPPDRHESLHFILVELFGRLFEQQSGELHRFDAHAASRSDAFRDRFKAFEGSRCQWDKPSFGPVRIRRSSSAKRNAKARLDVRQQLHRPKIAAAS